MTERTDSVSLPALVALREGLIGAARRDSGSTQRRRGWLAPTALAAICLLVAVALVAIPQDDDGVAPGVSAAADELVAPQSGSGLSLDGESHLTLAGLVDKSELVVAGTVERVRVGAEIVDIDPQYPTRIMHALVKVDRVLKGPAGRSAVTVATIDSAYASVPGAPAGATLEWRRPGERIVAFLAPAPGGRLFVPTSYSQSFYRLEGDSVVPLARQNGGTAGLPLTAFAAAVRAAAD